MKFSSASALVACIPAAAARFIEPNEVNAVELNPEQTFLIELGPGETQWVTEEEKWELRRVRDQDSDDSQDSIPRSLANFVAEWQELYGHHRE